MNPRKLLQAIVVPYDVDRQDTGGARGPRELLARGFPERLREAGWEIQEDEIRCRREWAAKEETVAEVGRGIAEAVALAHERRRFPLVLAGGCLAAVGTVAGLQRLGRDVAVVWIDAHGDFNTPETSPSGYWDGMALAAVCGRSLPAVCGKIELQPLQCRNVVHLAGRAFDPQEIEDIRRLELAVVPPDQICGEPALRRLRRCIDGRQLYLHVDLDGIDPQDAPAVGFPVPGGPRLDDLLRCLAELPTPAAMTFSAMSFDRATGEESGRMIETCLRLVEALGVRLP